MVEGFPPSSKSVSHALIHHKSFDYNALQNFKPPFSASPAGNAFLHIFPKQRTDAGSIPICVPLDVLTRIVRAMSSGQFRSLVHDFQISCIAENPVALAGSQFTNNPQPLQMLQGFIDRGRRDTCFFYQPV